MSNKCSSRYHCIYVRSLRSSAVHRTSVYVTIDRVCLFMKLNYAWIENNGRARDQDWNFMTSILSAYGSLFRLKHRATSSRVVIVVRPNPSFFRTEKIRSFVVFKRIQYWLFDAQPYKILDVDFNFALFSRATNDVKYFSSSGRIWRNYVKYEQI